MDLRSELGAPGLNTSNGNKPSLVKQLRKSLDYKTGKALPDTTILDTTTEDVDNSPDTSGRVGLAPGTRRRPSSSRIATIPPKAPRIEDPEPAMEEEPTANDHNQSVDDDIPLVDDDIQLVDDDVPLVNDEREHHQRSPTATCLRLSPVDLPKASSRSRECSEGYDFRVVDESKSVDRSHKTKRKRLDSEKPSRSKRKKDMRRLKIEEVKQEIETEMGTVLQNQFQIKEYDRSLVLNEIRELLDRRFQKIIKDVSVNSMTTNQILNYYWSRYSKEGDQKDIERILIDTDVDYVVPSTQITHMKPNKSKTEELLEFNRKLLEAKTQILVELDNTILRDYNKNMPEKEKTLLLKVFCNIVKERLETIIAKNQSLTTDEIMKEYKQKYTFSETKELIEKIIKDNQNGIIELDRSSPEKSPRELTDNEDEECSDDIWAEVDELLMDIQRDFEFVNSDTETGDESLKVKLQESPVKTNFRERYQLNKVVNKLHGQMAGIQKKLFLTIYNLTTKIEVEKAVKMKIRQRIIALEGQEDKTHDEIVKMYRKIYPRLYDEKFLQVVLEDVLKEAREDCLQSNIKIDCKKEVKTDDQSHNVPEESVDVNKQNIKQSVKTEEEPEQTNHNAENNIKDQEMSDCDNISNKNSVSNDTETGDESSKVKLQESQVETKSIHPYRYNRPVNRLLVKMRSQVTRFVSKIADDDQLTKCKLAEGIKIKMRQRIINFLEGKEKNDEEIVEIYRKIHPMDTDTELLEEALREVKEGKYDNSVEFENEIDCKMDNVTTYHRHTCLCHPDMIMPAKPNGNFKFRNGHFVFVSNDTETGDESSKVKLYKSPVKTNSRSPDPLRTPICKLIRQMKSIKQRFFSKIDVRRQNKLIEEIRIRVRQRIITFLEGQEYKTYNQIVQMYREIHPRHTDAEFLKEVLKCFYNDVESNMESDCKKDNLKIDDQSHNVPEESVDASKQNIKQTLKTEEEPEQTNNAENNIKDQEMSDCDNISNKNIVSNGTNIGDESSKVKKKSPVETNSIDPYRYNRPVNRLLAFMRSQGMRFFDKIADDDQLTKCKLVEGIRVKMRQRIINFLGGKEKNFEEIVKMYTEIHSMDTDTELLEETLKEVKDGKYDNSAKFNIENYSKKESRKPYHKHLCFCNPDPVKRLCRRYGKYLCRNGHFVFVSNDTETDESSKVKLQKSTVKTNSKTPDLLCPSIDRLSREMKCIRKKLFSNFDQATRCKLLEAVRLKVRQRIITFLEGQGYKTDTQIINMYREIHPRHTDAELLEEVIKCFFNLVESNVENDSKKDNLKKDIQSHNVPKQSADANKENIKPTDKKPKQINQNAENNLDPKLPVCNNIRNQNVRLLANKHVTTLLSLPIVAGTSTLRMKLLTPVIEATNSLRKLDLPVDQWSFLLLHIVLSKLPTDVKMRFEQLQLGSDTHLPTFDELMKFLEKECLLVDNGVLSGTKATSIKRTEQAAPPQNVRPKGAQQLPATSRTLLCVYCKSVGHLMPECEQFLRWDVQNRYEIIRNCHWCYMCLGNHLVWRCPHPRNCACCQGKHHELLCININRNFFGPDRFF